MEVIILYVCLLYTEAAKKWTATEKENEMKVRDWLKHTKDRISAMEVQAEEEMDWSEN